MPNTQPRVKTVVKELPHAQLNRIVSRELLRLVGVVVVTLFLYIVPLALFPQGSGNAATFYSLLLVGIVTLALSIWSEYTALLLAITTAVTQNTILGLVHGDDGAIPVAVSETKSIILVILAGVMLLRAVFTTRFGRYWFLLAIAYALGVVALAAQIDQSFAANARNFILPFLLLIAIIASTRSNQALLKIRLYLMAVGLAIFLAIGSILEAQIGSRSWKRIMNVDTLAGLNALSEQTMVFGRSALRVGGFLVEPINAGYVASFLLSYLLLVLIDRLWHPRQGQLLVIFGLLLGCIAALSTIFLAATKNSLLVVATAVVCYLLISKWPQSPRVAFGLTMAFGTVSTFVYTATVQGASYLAGVWSDPIGRSGGESTSIHIAGLLEGVYSLAEAPFGHGVGSGGNFYRLYNPEISRHDWLSTGAESALGTFVYQTGIIGVVLLGLVLYFALPKLHPIGLAVFTSWFCASLFSEAIFGSIVAIPAIVLAAYLLPNQGVKDAQRGTSKSQEATPSVLHTRKRAGKA